MGLSCWTFQGTTCGTGYKQQHEGKGQKYTGYLSAPSIRPCLEQYCSPFRVQITKLYSMPCIVLLSSSHRLQLKSYAVCCVDSSTISLPVSAIPSIRGK